MSSPMRHNSVININRVCQNNKYAPRMTVYFVISLPKTPNIHRIYMVLANPKYKHKNPQKNG